MYSLHPDFNVQPSSGLQFPAIFGTPGSKPARSLARRITESFDQEVFHDSPNFFGSSAAEQADQTSL
jgi:hypothetical protein